MQYGPDPEPEATTAKVGPGWSNGQNPGSVLQKRRVHLALLNTMAHLLYEGGAYQWEDSIRGQTQLPVEGRVTLSVTLDSSAFWTMYARLKKERGWRL